METIKFKKLEDILNEKDYRAEDGTLILVWDFETWEMTGKEKTDRLTVGATRNFTPNDSLHEARGELVTITEPFYTITPKEDLDKIRKRQEEIYWQIEEKSFQECKATFLQKLNHEVPNKKKFLESELERYREFKLPSDLKHGYRRFSKIIPEHLDNGHLNIYNERPNQEPKWEGYDRFGQWLWAGSGQ